MARRVPNLRECPIDHFGGTTVTRFADSIETVNEFSPGRQDCYIDIALLDWLLLSARSKLAGPHFANGFGNVRVAAVAGPRGDDVGLQGCDDTRIAQ